MLARAVARHIAALGIDGVTLDEHGTGGTVFLQVMPSAPDVAVCVSSYGGTAQPTLTATDEPRLQIRVRGARSVSTGGYETARAIYAAMACLDGVWLDEGGPDEVWVIGCTPLQSDPVPLGVDSVERQEWAVNLQFMTHAPTPNRPT